MDQYIKKCLIHWSNALSRSWTLIKHLLRLNFINRIASWSMKKVYKMYVNLMYCSFRNVCKLRTLPNALFWSVLFWVSGYFNCKIGVQNVSVKAKDYICGIIWSLLVCLFPFPTKRRDNCFSFHNELAFQRCHTSFSILQCVYASSPPPRLPTLERKKSFSEASLWRNFV